jgi:hypothetical protein
MQGTAAATALASVAGLAIFLFVRNGEDGTAGPTRTVASQLPAQPSAARPAVPLPTLKRVEPFEGFVAFLEPTTRVEFPSTSRVILTSGTVTLRLKAPTGAKLVIETPTAKVTVTGTILSVSVEPSGTGVDVLRGRVEVLARGKLVVLTDRQRLRPRSTAAESLPADRAARLAALFPDERPLPTVAVAPSTAATSAHGSGALPVRPEVARVPDLPRSDSFAPREGAVDCRLSTVDAQPCGSVDESYKQAESAMRDGRPAEAAELLRGILGRVQAGGAREETALIDLAQVCEQVGDLAGEREALERYLDRHPTGAFREDARADLCRVLQRTGPPAALISCLEEYLGEFPSGRKAQWARQILDASGPEPSRGDGG